jgi:phage gp36-like protein
VTKVLYLPQFDWQFWYGHTLDDHNNVDTIFLVGSFLFDCKAEVNSYLGIQYALYLFEMLTLQYFCCKLGWQLIVNPNIEDEVTKHHSIVIETIHNMSTAPYNAYMYSNYC